MDITLIAIFIFLSIIIGLFIWSLFDLRQKSIKDWKTLEELKEKVNKINTKEEIEEFHKEFLEKAVEINNPYINIELHKIDGYVRGLYKKFKN